MWSFSTPVHGYRAILWGGLIAGVLDLAYAIVAYASLRGLPAITIPHAIASGLLGVRSFQGGVPTAILGVALHFLIAFVAASVYYAASRSLRFLVSRAVAWGLVYGAAVYLFMHLVVLPLSAVPKGRQSLTSQASEFVEHMLFVGLPIALATRRYPHP